MSSFKEPDLTASDCKDAPQSPEGTAALKHPSTPSPGSQDSYGGFCPTPQKRRHSTDERNIVVPRKLFCLSPEPSDSNGSAGQEVQEPLLVRLPEESSSDGTVQQEVQDVEVDPLSDAQPELSGTTSVDDGSQRPARIVADPDDKEAGVVLRQQPVQPAPELDSKKAEEDVVPEEKSGVVLYAKSSYMPENTGISWKTLYNQYLEEVDHASLIVRVILQRYGLTKEHPQCMLGFIRCVADYQTYPCENPTTALTFLQRHSLYPKAEVCIARKLPDLDGRKETPAYVRAVMAAIVLFAGGVCDIQELMDCLQSRNFPMSSEDILEILYSMATLLYAMRENEVKISNRFHYSVSYCLHHLENSLCNTPSTNDPELPSSGGGFRPISQPTSEQQLILNHRLNPEDRVKIVGSAGTGKTSTLLQYAREWSELKFLFIAFNKIKKQSLLFCSKNVTCKTFHSLAYDEVGKKYRNKFIRDILTNEVGRVLSNPEASGTKVVQTLKTFLASADESITVEHTGCGEDVKEREKQIIVEEAKQIWAKMKELGPTEEKAYHMPFDGYLKLWQLQKPSLSTDTERYNVIMVDEAQDCTHAMMSIVLLQNCPVILVGNPHQQIYTFRGADNTVLDVPNSRIFYLTQSFWFGYEIAYVGATLLDVSRKIRKNMVGNYWAGVVRVEGKETWLSRTNRDVFDNAVKVTGGDSPAKIHFLGGINTVGLDIIEDLYNVLHSKQNYELKSAFMKELQSTLIKKYVEKGFRSIEEYDATRKKQLELTTGILRNYDDVPQLVRSMHQFHVPDPESAVKLEVKDFFIKRWVEKGLASIKDYAEKSEDKQLEIKIGIVEKYRERIPELVNRIRQCHVWHPEVADYILGTVHKAKGLEFDTVKIDDVFLSKSNLEHLHSNRIAIPKDEWNLLYVAVTRAKKHLILPSFFAQILEVAKEYCVRFELSTALSNTTPPVCVQCRCEVPIPEDPVLIPKRINHPYIVDNTERKGFLCSSCARSFGPIAQLTGSSRAQGPARLPETIEVPSEVHILLEDF
ncbi:F-box DNA helicase 1-like isoform X2 [Pantherophis guttatus]|uniref:DNA 3'-5' helicase n=1 Tax=Pantherophis guttatus TaxID=94885 RepID=A0ABM3Z3U2_PANGU|nr:F-box DNA helicase 1-like isoform X2 [Pantherophis guttatus]